MEKKNLKNICYSTMQDYIVSENDSELQCLKAAFEGVGSIAVLPTSLKHTAKYLKDSDVKVRAGISYPSGAYYPEIKAAEIAQILDAGYRPDEFLAVLAVGYFKSGYSDLLKDEIVACIKAAGEIPVSFILEAAVLDDAQLKEICGECKKAGAKAIVSSANFAPYGIALPKTADVARLVKAADGLPVYAFSDVRDEKGLNELFEAGAAEVIVNSIDGLTE